MTSNHIAATPTIHVVMRRFFGTKVVAEAQFNKKPQDLREPSSCGFWAVIHLHVQPHVLDQLNQTVVRTLLNLNHCYNLIILKILIFFEEKNKTSDIRNNSFY